MMTITYILGNKLYLNITNKCPCACEFCIRRNGEGAYGSDSLWLEHQPDLEEVIDALKRENLDSFDEIIFCGFGEPTCELGILLKTAKYIRSVTKTPIRINTNGLSDLINGYGTCKLMTGLFDTVSISLNASNKEEYNRVTQPKWKDKAFDAMINFAVEAKEIFPRVILSVVDVISDEEIEECKELCKKLGIELRVREYSA